MSMMNVIYNEWQTKNRKIRGKELNNSKNEVERENKEKIGIGL